jgi:transposase InsO family protein
MRALCEALRVSRSGYYAWCARDQTPCELNQAIERQFKQDKARAGAPSIACALQQAGMSCSARTVGRRMSRLGLRVRHMKKFKRTTDSNHTHAVAPNHLARQFAVQAPNRVWVSDITYLRTTQGWLYLAVFIDLFSRQVVGWQLSERIDAKLLCDALQAAMLMRGKPQGVLIHSDQGSQYCSAAFVKQVNQYQATQSMSRKGNCWDNAVAESFFATLKKEEIYGQALKSNAAIRAQVFEYIECDYNRVRRHSSNGWLSPIQFEHNYQLHSEVNTVRNCG